MDTLTTLVVMGTALGCAVNAGLFFIFSNTVMRALFDMPDPAQGVIAMQRINRVILNPGFMTVFMGTAALCVTLVVAAFLGGVSALVGAGAATYLVGVIAVTGAGNVPLNNALDATEPGTPEATAVWRKFKARWVPYNHLRTGACILAAALLAAASRGVGA